jgi:hypothetical protein
MGKRSTEVSLGENNAKDDRESAKSWFFFKLRYRQLFSLLRPISYWKEREREDQSIFGQRGFCSNKFCSNSFRRRIGSSSEANRRRAAIKPAFKRRQKNAFEQNEFEPKSRRPRLMHSLVDVYWWISVWHTSLLSAKGLARAAEKTTF